MCKFLSCVSNGEGVLKFFDIKDIAEQMAIGNPETYDWNSHTSICQYYGINSRAEDLWNKWEYDPKSKVLAPDTRPLGVKDDSDIIKPMIDKHFEGKNIDYLANLYNGNSGDMNKGIRNSGHWNDGNRNSGDWNTGYSNSGSCNSGGWNSGNWNNGIHNSGSNNNGDWNSGSWNRGKWNIGSSNSGNCNTGNKNHGDLNSGSCNSGSQNGGNYNSGDGVLNSFCTTNKYILFDKACTKKEYEAVNNLNYYWFDVAKWINANKMTDQEKSDNKLWAINKGYLKIIEYKEAWKKCPQEFIDKVKKLKNFCPKKFKEITGLSV